MPKIYLKTWGCTLNQSDSDIMRAILKAKGHSFAKNEKNADIIVLNTCTVKAATENKIFAYLKKLVRQRKNIVFAGCLAVNAAKIRAIAPYAPIVGPGAIEFIGKAVELTLGKNADDKESARKNQSDQKDPAANNEVSNQQFVDEFTAIKKKFHLPRMLTFPIARIPIAEGCVGNCTFCQTRLARPLLISYPLKLIVKFIEDALAKNAKEIQLTAMDSGAYGLDIGSDLVSLLREIVKIKGNLKIRLGMINPQHARKMENGLIEIFRNRKMFKFLHIPVQTGSSKVCKEMKRMHTVSDFKKIVWKFRKEIPDITIATDIIVGYPTETEKDYKMTLKLLVETKPDIVNLSKFTVRDGTEAKMLKQIKTEIMKKRSVEIHKIVQKITNENAQKFLGKKLDVLITEKGKVGQVKGRTINYRQVVVKGGRELIGKKLRVRITNANCRSLFGKKLK